MRTGRVLLAALALMLMSARGADAQVLGYGIAGPAGFSGFWGSGSDSMHPAAGGEALVRGIAGVGGEFGAIVGSGSYLFVYSINGVLHVLPARGGHRVSPFITGGYTHMYNRDGGFDAWNAGGGVDVWIRKRAGLRVDFRNHVRPDDRGTVQYWTLRAGVVLR